MEWEDLRSNKGCLRYGVEGAGSNMRHLGDGAGGSLVQHRGFWGYELGGLTDAVGSIWWMEKGSHGLATAFEGQSIPVQKPLPRLQPLSPPHPYQQDGMHDAHLCPKLPHGIGHL